MGLGIDTTCTFDFVLEADQDRPEDQRPSLTCRYLSVRDYRRLDRLFSETYDLKEFDQVYTKLLEGLQTVLVGWKNQPIPFAPAELETVLTPAELLEVRNRLLSEMTLSELDKKKSKRLSPSSTGSSASERKENAGPALPK